MPDRDATGRNRSLLAELSDADAQLAERALEQHEKRVKKTLDAGRREFENARDDADRKLSNLVGKKDLPALRRALRDEHLRMRDLLQPPKGLDRDLATLNTARKRKGDALLKEFGVSRDKLAKIGADFQQRVQKIGAPVIGEVAPAFHTRSNIAQWMKLSPLHASPLPWGVAPPVALPGDPGPFTLFKPPFFDWPDRFIALDVTNFEVTRKHVSHAFTGFVGHDLSIGRNSGFLSFAGVRHVSVDTRMGFIFDIPADGFVEVIVDAMNATGEHDLRTRDEWGWSKTVTSQTNFLSVHVLHPNLPDPFLAETSRLKSEDISTTLHVENLNPGEHFFAHFVSALPVTAGRSVVILVGHKTSQFCIANHVGYDSAASFHWLIKSVEVRIRP